MTDKIADDRKRGWYWLDNEIVDHYGPIIGSDSLSVYNVLVRHSDQESHSFPSLRVIGERTHLSRNTVVAALKRLVDAGLITIEHRQDESGDPTSNLYTLLNIKGGRSAVDLPTSSVDLRVGQQVNRGRSPVDHEQDLINKTESEEEKAPESIPASLESPPSDPLWDRCLNQLRLQMTRSTWDTWLRNTTAERIDGRLVVHAAVPHGAEWLNLRLRRVIERTVTAVAGEPLAVEFTYSKPEE